DGSPEVDSSEAEEENMALPRSASGDATGIPPTNLSASRADRKRLLLGQAQAFGSGAGPQPAHAEASSPAARLEFQSVSPETSLPLPEDVNRAILSLERFDACLVALAAPQQCISRNRSRL